MLVWNFEELRTNDGESPCEDGTERLLTELNTANWWRDEQRQLPLGNGDILCIILSSDATHMTSTGWSLHPMYVCLGNIPRWWRQKPTGWSIIGFLPVIRVVKAFKDTEEVKQYRRDVGHWVMEEVCKVLIDNWNGLSLDIVNEANELTSRFVYPRMPYLVGDEPEVGNLICGTKPSALSRMPCSTCLVCPKQDGLTFDKAPLRDPGFVRRHMDQTTRTCTMTKADSHTLSMNGRFNPAYFIAGLNPFANPPCRMHSIDQGVGIMMKELITKFLTDSRRQLGLKGTLARYDHRWCNLARYPGGKLFKRGVSSLAFVTAHEHRTMYMGLPFVLNGMIPDTTYKALNLNPHFLEWIAITFLQWRWCLGQHSVSDSMREAIHVLALQVQRDINILSVCVVDHDVSYGIKFHKMIHWAKHYIPMFGVTSNYNAEVFEHAHKEIVKPWVGKVSVRDATLAGKRILIQNQIYDAHLMERPSTSSHDRHSIVGAPLDDDLPLQPPPPTSSLNGDIAPTTADNGYLFSDEDRSLELALTPPTVTEGHALAQRQPITARQKSQKWKGPGCFRGLYNMAKWLELSYENLRALRAIECTRRYADASVEDIHTQLSDVLDSGEYKAKHFSVVSPNMNPREQLKMVWLVLMRSGAFNTSVTPITDDEARHPMISHDEATFWHITHPRNIFLYKMSYCSPSSTYVQQDSWVAYQFRTGNDGVSGTLKDDCVGQVKWMCSIHNEQFILILRYSMSRNKHGPRRGERTEHRILRQAKFDRSKTVDPLTLHCWVLTRKDHMLSGSYDVLRLSNTENRIKSIVMVQPDFRGINESGNGDYADNASRFYLLEYVIQ